MSETVVISNLDAARCFGCGVCRAVCPNDAISLMPRQEHPEVANVWLKNRLGKSV
ncbi:TPA: 4Fe-4S dicluster domain-containing protein [Candidatus Poribacteria bacterium]|nr:4Fe-4S dicluster domain-containing protein [Candidatus Poribacteria bacterium]